MGTIKIWVGRDYSLPQGCPSNLDPHMPDTCGDPEHAILAMSDTEYAEYLSGSKIPELAERIRTNPKTSTKNKNPRKFTTDERDALRTGAIALGETLHLHPQTEDPEKDETP